MKPLTYDRTKETRKAELLKGEGYDVLNVYKYDRFVSLVSLDPLTLKKQKAIANLLKLIEYPLTADEIIGYKDEITLTVVSSRYKNRYSKKPNPDPNPNVVFTSPDGNVILVWID